jgi:hypothetical protein
MSVLVIGVSAMAALCAAMLTNGRQSKYMSLAGTLASEKLEDLNRWQGSFSTAGVDTSDPEICVQPGDTQEGSIAFNAQNQPVDVKNYSITCGTNPAELVNYADDVSVDVTNSTTCPNPTDGCFAETTSTTVSGVTTYYTTYHSPDGSIPGNPSTTYPQSPVSSNVLPANMTTFHRQWIIEANPVVNGTAVAGVRRITVLVTDQQVQPNIRFQMSMIRP